MNELEQKLYDACIKVFKNNVDDIGERQSLEVLRDVTNLCDKSENFKVVAPELKKFIHSYTEDHGLCPDCFSNELSYVQDAKPSFYSPGEAHLKCTACGWRSDSEITL
jgi:DNA-directed RNA polymerase subunit M/transcription elongation factor TFIIS